MPKPLTIAFPQVYVTVAGDLMQRIGDAQAAIAGPPIGDPVEPATDADRVNAWNARNPEATDEAMLQRAQQKYQEHIQSGMPADVAQKATAEDLTHFRYGQRLTLYTYGQVGYTEQVKEAQRLSKLAARTSTPNPPLPPPDQATGALTNLQTMGLTPEDLPAAPASTLGAPAPTPGLEMAPPPSMLAPASPAPPPPATPPPPGRY
jgi:hypothetical protein